MFERYTEKAQRVIFFARYEASQYGSPVIDTNGHDWLCMECYAKFWERLDFFSSSYSDIT